MNDSAAPSSIPLERRIALLAKIPGFASLPPGLLEKLGRNLREIAFASGAVVVREGDVGDQLFLIETGTAEATTNGPAGPVSLARIGAGEIFGEIALLAHSRERQATVKALSPLRVLALSAAGFDQALAAYPDARFDLVQAAEAMLRTKRAKSQG